MLGAWKRGAMKRRERNYHAKVRPSIIQRSICGLSEANALVPHQKSTLDKKINKSDFKALKIYIDEAFEVFFHPTGSLSV